MPTARPNPVRLHVIIRRVVRDAQGIYSLGGFKPDLAKQYAEKLIRHLQCLRGISEVMIAATLGPKHADAVRWAKLICCEWHRINESGFSAERWAITRRLLPMADRLHEVLRDELVAAAVAEPLKVKPTAENPASTPAADAPSMTLMRVFTNGIVDERIRQAAQTLVDDTLTANEKLTRIDELIHFPPTASAEQLGKMLGVTKQAVMKTGWWCKNRRGETQEEIDRRFDKHEERRGTPIDRRRVNRKGASSVDDDDEL